VGSAVSGTPDISHPAAPQRLIGLGVLGHVLGITGLHQLSRQEGRI
jgi:hypothetical protein